jgi:hypothetical protein
MKHIILLLIAAASLPAQGIYTKVYEKTLAGAAGATTIQQPTSPSKTAHLIGIQLYSSVDATFELEATTAATGSSTNGVPTTPSYTPVSTVVHYADSNAADNSTNINKYTVPGGTTTGAMFLDGHGNSTAKLSRTAGQNFTIRSNSITGNIRVTWMWMED